MCVVCVCVCVCKCTCFIDELLSCSQLDKLLAQVDFVQSLFEMAGGAKQAQETPRRTQSHEVGGGEGREDHSSVRHCYILLHADIR